MSTEPTEAVQEEATTAPEEPDAESATFTPEYVRGLRREAAERRRAAKEAEERLTVQEVELAELREARLHRAIADANAARPARLADVNDLLTFGDATVLVDDDGKPDPQRIEAAIDALIRRKPHLAEKQRVSGSADQGARGALPAVMPSLGALVGRAARGEVDPPGGVPR